MALGSLGPQTSPRSTALPASPRFLAAAIAIRILLVLGVLAAGDLGYTALAAVISAAGPGIGLIGGLDTMLRHLSFYVSVTLAAVTMVVGAVVVWREPRLNRPGVIIVVSGILSAASVALILLIHVLR